MTSASSPPPSSTPNQASGDSGEAIRLSLDFSKLRQVRLRDFALRFLFGGAISVLAALLGSWVAPRFGGLFTTFPAILLASLTLLGRKEGKERAIDDAKGAVVGAIALVVCAGVLVGLLSWLSGALALGVALFLWLLVASSLYFLSVRKGWLRHEPGKDHPER